MLTRVNDIIGPCGSPGVRTPPSPAINDKKQKWHGEAHLHPLKKEMGMLTSTFLKEVGMPTSTILKDMALPTSTLKEMGMPNSTFLKEMGVPTSTPRRP